MIRVLDFLAPPPQKETGNRLGVVSITNGQWFNQSHLCNEASLKTLREALGSFQVDEQGEVLGGWCEFRAPSSDLVPPHLAGHLQPLHPLQ